MVIGMITRAIKAESNERVGRSSARVGSLAVVLKVEAALCNFYEMQLPIHSLTRRYVISLTKCIIHVRRAAGV